MVKQNQKMGLNFIPFTFPTYKVLEYISATAGVDPTLWKREKVESLYRANKDAVQKAGYEYFQKGVGTGLREYIMAQTGYAHADVAIYLISVHKMVQEGKLDSYYLTFKEATKPITAPDMIKKIARPIENVSKNIKWIGLIALAGVGIYFAWPYLKKIRKRG